VIKDLQVAIDFRVKILSVQGIKSRIQDIMASEDRWDGALPEAKRAPPWQGRGNAAQAAFSHPFGRARACALGHVDARGPLSPGAYKYPPGVFSLSRSRE